VGVAPSRLQGKPYLEIAVRRDLMGRYGLRVADVFRYVEAGLGGATVTTTIKGRDRWPIQVRLDRADRDDLEKIGDLLIPTPSGPSVPLRQITDIRRVMGPSEIGSENGRLRAFVQTNVQGRDLGGFVEEIKARVARDVKLEPGMTVEYSGQYEHQLSARQTLTYVFPAVILIIFVLLVITFHSVAEAAHGLLAVPFALTGGVILQFLLGYNFSVAVWVGYIALFGTAIQTGVVMVVYLEEAVKKKLADKGFAAPETADGAPDRHNLPLTRAELLEAVKAGARLRLRPKVMTVATTVAALLPIFWLERTGIEVMRPLAAPVVGGMLSSLVHILIVTPVIFAWLRERRLSPVANGHPGPKRGLSDLGRLAPQKNPSV
jgi:copper/silver efflux system protein